MTLAQCFLHILTIGWKVLFSLIPPKTKFYGVPTMLSCYVLMALVLVIVRECALLMACVLDIPPAVISMTLLTFGMSLSDTIVIRRTAKKSRYIAGLSGID